MWILNITLCILIFKFSGEKDRLWSVFNRCLITCGLMNLYGATLVYALKEKNYLHGGGIIYDIGFGLSYILTHTSLMIIFEMGIGFGIAYIIYRRRFKKIT